MAECVTVQSSDTLTRILQNKRNVDNRHMQQWVSRTREINPHIGHVDRIYPGEKLLIPDRINENVTRHAIWQNALSRVPSALNHTTMGNTVIFFPNGSENIDTLAEKTFAGSPHHGLPHSTKRAILIYNNPQLELGISTNSVPAGGAVNLSPYLLAGNDKSFWSQEHANFNRYLNMLDPTVRDLYQQAGPEDVLTFAEIARNLKSMGAAVGMDDVVKTIGYGAAGASGGAAAGLASLSTVNRLAADLYADAVRELGESVVLSKKATHLARVQAFLKNHPKYRLLMNNLKSLPEFLLPKGRLMPNTSGMTNFPLARHMRKQFFIANVKPGLSQRMGTIANGLNGKIKVLKGVGKGATWVLPAAIGIYNVANASPERRLRVLLEEGGGIILGAFGTSAGISGGLILLTALSFGPFGAFITLFILGGAGGIIGSKIGNYAGGAIYDISEQLHGTVFHKIENITGVL